MVYSQAQYVPAQSSRSSAAAGQTPIAPAVRSLLALSVLFAGVSLTGSSANAQTSPPATPPASFNTDSAIPAVVTPAAPATTAPTPTTPATPIPPPPSLLYGNTGGGQANPTPLSVPLSADRAPSPASPTPTSQTTPKNNAQLRSGDVYTLGGGDQIRIDIFDVPEFSGSNGQYTLLADGSLNLPWIGKVSLQDRTLEEAASILTMQYAPYIRNPRITVTLLAPRSMRIGIIGQVNRPGVYTVTPGGNAPRQTVTLAIQTAGGITQTADIRKIEVRRPRSNGGEDVIAVNLWNFLQGGDLSQDAVLRDGDTLVIPEATELNPTEMGQVAIANISPATINVNVVGEVVRPGTVTIPPNSTLNQALLAAGGFNNQRARRSKVELVRLNPNGTVTRREVEVNFSANVNDATNPPLRANDIIIVGRSSLASTSDFLGSVLSPLNGIFGIFRLLGGFGLF